MGIKCFKSTGTIRVTLSNGSPSTIFFTPNSDSTVRRGDKRYAVFLQESSEKSLVRNLGDAGEGVSIKVNAVNGAFSGLIEAAAQQTLVEVSVQDRKGQAENEKAKTPSGKGGTKNPSSAPATEAQKDDPDLTLCAITIPAPGKQK